MIIAGTCAISETREGRNRAATEGSGSPVGLSHKLGGGVGARAYFPTKVLANRFF